MILLCPLIHPPNRCRSQWLHTNAFFPSILWINVRLVSSGNERHSKGEMRVCAFSCVCLSKSGVCVWERDGVCVHTVLSLCLFCCVGGWNGGSLECVFVCVCFRQSSPTLCPFSCDGLFVRHRHKIIRLVVVCLWSVLSCPSWFVIQRGISPVWLLSEDLSSLCFCKRRNKASKLLLFWSCMVSFL